MKWYYTLPFIFLTPLVNVKAQEKSSFVFNFFENRGSQKDWILFQNNKDTKKYILEILYDMDKNGVSETTAYYNISDANIINKQIFVSKDLNAFEVDQYFDGYMEAHTSKRGNDTLDTKAIKFLEKKNGKDSLDERVKSLFEKK